MLRLDTLWRVPLCEWGLDPECICALFREPSGQGETVVSDVLQLIPRTQLPVFVTALCAIERREAGGAPRWVAQRYLEYELELIGETLYVCVSEGAWPSGEVAATDDAEALPNPMYVFGGLRCMCNRRLLSHRLVHA